MEKSIKYFPNRTLKLTNALQVVVDSEDFIEFSVLVENMENYIRSKGAVPVGPLVQKTRYEVNDEGEVDVEISLIRQVNTYIHSVEHPYKMDSIIRVKDCMYVRYCGPENKLKFAYDKINLIAFEEDIDLANESFTVYVDEAEDNIIADVFVEKKNR